MPGKKPIFTTQIAWVYQRLVRYHGISVHLASQRLHDLKQRMGRDPDEDLLLDLTGNIYDPTTKERLGSLTEGGAQS